MARHQAMSMEAMLDEERREVLALLEGTAASNRPKAPSPLAARSPSPYTTPRSPVRSMLDIGEQPLFPKKSKSVPHLNIPNPLELAPVRSMLDVDSPPPQQPVRSMLDVDSPPSSTHRQILSSPSSPVDSSSRSSYLSNSSHPRSMSDASSKPVDFGPRSSASRLDPTLEYQFSGIITNNSGTALPKRVTQGGKRAPAATAMAEVMRGGGDLSGLSLPGDRGRHSVSGPTARLKEKSKSPHNRLGVRSNSPHLSSRPLSPAGRAFLGEAQNIDMNNAYRRLSDAMLARSGGSLSELGRRKRSDDLAGSGRLAKDYFSPDGDILPEDSSDDNGSSSEDEGERGRKTARDGPGKGLGSPAEISSDPTRAARSMLAAAEEERKFYHQPSAFYCNNANSQQ